MHEKSTMFLSQVTVVDHAYIDDCGNIIGGSFNPGFLVTGSIDSLEKVVVDFSTIKKTIKSFLDEGNDGFDHKLWLLEGYSLYQKQTSCDRVHVTTPALELDIPENSVKIFSAQEYSLQEIERAFALYLNRELDKRHPGIEIRCLNSIEVQLLQKNIPPVSYFSYCHGLKNSTSWGCQNNSHGHLSFISLHSEVEKEKTLQLQKQIASELDRAIFLWRENITGKEGDWVVTQYRSRDRGDFYAKYNTLHNKLVVLDSETTVEFLIEYVCSRWQEVLQNLGVSVVMLSEGLAKGAYVEFVE